MQGYPAQVQVRGATEELLALAKSRHALDPAALDERPPFFFQAEISSTRLDAYFTHMTASTLANYAAEAADGVAFQDSHHTRALPLGRTLTGRVENLSDGLMRVVSDIFILPGLDLGTATDDIIAAIRAGVVKDVSVGFNGGRFLCDICKQDLFRSDCPHIPGFEYAVDAPGGRTLVTATAGVEGAHLAEVSAVYAGATPGAAVLKAEAEAVAGRLKPEARQIIEARYRVRLPDPRVLVPGVSFDAPASMEGKTMTEADQGAALTRILDALRLPDTEADAPAFIRGLYAEQERLTGQVGDLQKRVAELEPEAELGRKYRAFLVRETMAEGVRALGEAFPAETMQTMLNAADVATVETLLSHYRGIAAETFVGGRRSVDVAVADDKPDGEDGKGTLPGPVLSDNVYKG